MTQPLKLASVSGSVVKVANLQNHKNRTQICRKLHIQSCSLSLILMVSVGHELVALKCHMMCCTDCLFVTSVNAA